MAQSWIFGSSKAWDPRSPLDLHAPLSVARKLNYPLDEQPIEENDKNYEIICYDEEYSV